MARKIRVFEIQGILESGYNMCLSKEELSEFQKHLCKNEIKFGYNQTYTEHGIIISKRY